MADTPFHLHGKTVLVTGASAGIGAQAAISISKMGGTVIVTGRKEDKLKETISHLEGKNHQYFICDLLKENEIEELVASLPALDGVVHCAGIVSPFPVRYINDHKIEETFGINYSAPVLLMSALLSKKKINAKASIVFISSFAGSFPYRGGALYAGSKAALEKYSVVLASEHAKARIRSNCISPGLVKTSIIEKAFSGDWSEYKKFTEEKHLLGLGDVEDVGNMIVFLLSDASRWLTGQNIILDGGYLLGLISKTTNE